MSKIKSEEIPTYKVEHLQPVPDDLATICQAIAILEARLRKPGEVLNNPETTKQYFFTRLSEEPAEVFSVLFLDTRHRAIECDDLFYGTIDGATIHPREVVRHAIEYNAKAVILCHNHPSGNPEPSSADIKITNRLVEALKLIDVRVLDHIVIGNTAAGAVSFAERGLI